MTRRPVETRSDAGSRDEQALREAFSRWASGVAVVAVRSESGNTGLTVSAFVPLSLDPPLVLVALGGDAPVLTAIRDAGRFTVNVLAAGQRRAANVFSDRYPVGVPPFEPGDDAILTDTHAVIVCDLEREIEGGDHRILIGRVRASRTGPEGSALLHYRRAWDTIG